MISDDNNFVKLVVHDDYVGIRLDLFLSFKLHELSRSQIKKIIESNRVFVNDSICFKCAYKLKINDTVFFPSEYLLKNVQNNKNIYNSNHLFVVDLDILYEDNDYFVVNKPIGINVHRTSYYDNEISLVDKINALYKKNLPGDPIRPGVVHRLDKMTSGVLIFAKNPMALWWLSKQFAERKVEKSYISIGLNDKRLLPNKKDYIDNNFIKVEGYIRRSSKNRKLFVLDAIHQKTKFNNDSKYSLSLFYKLSDRFIDKLNLSLFYIIPKTGRTHQIRVHQKYIGYPILGDNLYLPNYLIISSNNILNKFNITSRLFLHSYFIKFYNYDGSVKIFTSDLPIEFIQIFNDAEQKITLFKEKKQNILL